jgi:hypothetical protein
MEVLPFLAVEPERALRAKPQKLYCRQGAEPIGLPYLFRFVSVIIGVW